MKIASAVWQQPILQRGDDEYLFSAAAAKLVEERSDARFVLAVRARCER